MKLYYFHPREFDRNGEAWFSKMDVGLLVKLDVLRHMWGKPIHVSKSRHAVGRRRGDAESQHNIEKWGEVRAVDVMPEGINYEDDADRFHLLAKHVGFTGIGFYPDWSEPGFHLDVRQDRRPGDPATWGKVGHMTAHFVSLNDAIEAMV